MRAAAIAFLGGILVVQQLAALPSLVWALLLLPALLLSLRHPRWLLVVFFLGGFAWAIWRADLILQDRLPSALEGRDVVVEGVVAELPQATEYGSRFAFDVTAANVGGATVSVPHRIRLSVGPDVAARAGELWRFTARLKRPHGLQNPGGFDYEAYLFRNRLRATGYARAAPAPTRLGEGGARYAIDRWRDRLGERMRAAIGDDSYGGLIVALANGDEGGITDKQWETLRRTGTLHLVAISGLHISLIAGVFYWLVRHLWSLPGVTVLRLPAQFAGAIGGLIAAAIYAALAGFVIPTQRALIMLGVAMGAVLLRRRPPPGLLLAAALLAVLVFDPFAVMAAGFWLSYAAVAIIIYVIHGERGAGALWRKAGYLQWAIAIGMVPLMLWLFQRVSFVAPLANLVAVPVFDTLVVPLTLLAALTLGTGWHGAAAALFQLDSLLLNGLWYGLAYLASFSWAQWVQHQPPVWTVVCGLVGAALLLAPRGWPARAIGVVWLLPMFLVRPPVPPPAAVWFTLLDVGQGLAAVVRTEHHALVFDTGARWSARSDAGRSVVVPYLRAVGIERIDTLLVSHGDNDHAGGAASVIDAVPVTRVLTGAPNVAGEACHAGRQWRWDGVDFIVLNPTGALASRNDASCVLRVRSRYGSILLPADIEAPAEHDLMQRQPAGLHADVLIAPHHGSRTSSSAEFIDAVHPAYVAFPIGYRNRYHHPHPAVVDRYRARGIGLYDTATGGAVEFRLSASGVTVATYRARHRRYWHTQLSLP
jgi:competence protein ComEC